MTRFAIKRLMLAIITIVGVTMVVFVIARLSGDVVYLILPEDASEADAQALRVQLGLHRPIWEQYVSFVHGIAVGDFGQSFRYQQPTMEIILSRVPASLLLVFTAFLFAIIAGITLGMASARWRGTVLDRLISVVAVLGQAVPNFWMGMVAILVFAVWLQWLPTSGSRSIQHLILPAATLSMFTTAAIMRMTRTAMLETLESDYVKFLRAKGVPEWQVWWRHALRNSMVPLIALSGVQLANMLGGAVIIENVFSWPGLGSLIVEAIASRDYPMIQACVLVTSIFLIMLNLVVDLMFGLIDPRIRYE